MARAGLSGVLALAITLGALAGAVAVAQAPAASASRPLLLVGGSDYPPLSYLQDGVPTGYDVDVARALGTVLGREVRVELMDWAAAQRRVLEGDADGLTNLAISNERRELYEFASSTITQNFGLFVRVGDTTLRGVSDLTGRSVGVTEWGFPRQYLAQQPRVNLVVVDDLRAGFDRLVAGDLDVVAADVWVATHLIESRGVTGIALAGAPFASLPAAIAIKKGNHALVEDINRALEKLEADGTLIDIQEKWRPREMVFLSRERVQDLVAWGVGAFLVVLLLAATVWALTLRRQIRDRRTAEGVARESSQRLGLALSAADAGTWRWDPVTNIDTRDASLNRMLGLPAVETANTLEDILDGRVHPEDRVAVRTEFDRAIRERNAYSSEFRVVWPDGTIRWLRGRGRPFYDEAGTLLYVTGVATDVTEQHQVAERVTLLARAFESASDSMAITDAQDRILHVNQAFLDMNEYERREVIGQPIRMVRAPDQPDVAGIDTFKAGADSWRGEIWCVTKSGRKYAASLTRSVLRDATGQVVGAIGAVRDITNETLAEAALRTSEEKFYKVFQTSPDSISIIDTGEAGVLDVNESFERQSGYTRSEVIGRRLIDLGLFPDLTLRDRVLERLRTERSIRGLEFQLRRRTGELFSIVAAIEIIEIGGRTCFLTTSRDVTDQKRFELHLRQAAEINKLLLSELDPEGLHVAVIEATHQILDLDYASLMLHDARTRQWQLAAERSAFGSDRAIHIGQALSAWVLEHEQIRLHRRDDLVALGGAVASLVDGGLRWVCSLPLETPRGTLGVLNVGSRNPDACSPDNVTLLQQLSTHVAIAIQNAHAYEEIRVLKDQLSQEKLYLEEEIRVDHNFADIVGDSGALMRVLQQVETVAATESSVLILGETGTGKELLARAIHEISPRKDRTFVRLNVAALPATLLESELFGYERGAFTGATASKVGRMELAHRGTLFLDEVGDIPLEVQPKLLRALQEREFERLGSTRTMKVDVRLIAATNRDLARMVEEGTFRSDLFYRLNVFPVNVPPLRERREDIPALVRYFVQKFAGRLKRQITSIPALTMAALQEWEWPGNIRELENVIERAVVLSTGDTLQVPPFPAKPIVDAPAARPGMAMAGVAMPAGSFADGERNIILRALREADGIIAGPQGAAARLGMKRTTLQSKMRKLGITRPVF